MNEQRNCFTWIKPFAAYCWWQSQWNNRHHPWNLESCYIISKESWAVQRVSVIKFKRGRNYKQTAYALEEKWRIIKYLLWGTHLSKRSRKYWTLYYYFKVKGSKWERKEGKISRGTEKKFQIEYKRLETDVYIKPPMEWWNPTDCGTNLTRKGYGKQTVLSRSPIFYQSTRGGGSCYC